MRKRLTYTNVMSSIAVFLVLGGATAFAAHQLGKNTVGTKQIKKNAVNESKLAKDAVTGAKVKDGSLTGADVNAATLGNVPSASKATSSDRATSAGNADALGGIAATGFVQGRGQLVSGRRQLAVGETEQSLLALPGIGSITASCLAGNELSFTLHNEVDALTDVVYSSGNPSPVAVTLAAKTATLILGDNIDQSWQFQISTRANPSTVANMQVSFSQNAPGAPPCVVFAQGTVGT